MKKMKVWRKNRENNAKTSRRRKEDEGG